MVKLKVVFRGLAVAIFLTVMSEVWSKGQFVQPLNMGMQMAIPYDIANIFNRPIAGITSVILTVGLAAVLLFGVITAPFGYFFGIPSRKMVMGGPPEKPVTLRRNSRSLETDFDIFLKSMVYLLPDDTTPSCQKYIICFAHGTLKHLPVKAINFYKYFSGKLRGVPDDYREAVELGLEDNLSCEDRYRDCPNSIFSILIRTLVGWLPERSRKKSLKPNSRQQN